MRNIQNRALRQAIGNRVFSKPVLAINLGGAATIKTTNAIDYSVGGIMLTKAALAAQALTAVAAVQEQITGIQGFYTQQANKTAYIALGIDASGNVRAFQGLSEGQTSVFIGSTEFIIPVAKVPRGDGNLPDPNAFLSDDTYTIFGCIKVVTGATTFLPGTDALDKASVTFTFTDLSGLPTSLRP